MSSTSHPPAQAVDHASVPLAIIGKDLDHRREGGVTLRRTAAGGCERRAARQKIRV